jgi:hypothetical protein
MTVPEEFAMDCPGCGLTIATPTVIAQEPAVFDPAMDAFRVRVLIGPNDVEYQTHVIACEGRTP